MQSGAMCDIFWMWRPSMPPSCTNCGRAYMDRHPNDVTTDEEIDDAIEKAQLLADEPLIVEAAYRPEPGLDFLMLRLSDGRRLLIPREELGELKDATAE